MAAVAVQNGYEWNMFDRSFRLPDKLGWVKRLREEMIPSLDTPVPLSRQIHNIV